MIGMAIYNVAVTFHVCYVGRESRKAKKWSKNLLLFCYGFSIGLFGHITMTVVVVI